MSGIASSIPNAILRPPRAIVNACSVSGGTVTAVMTSVGSTNNKLILSGALTAGTLATVLSLSGGGAMPLCFLHGVDATARTLRLQIIVDGTTVFDPGVTASLTSTTTAVVAAGDPASLDASNFKYIVAGAPVYFNSSLVVKIASSLTETDKLQLQVQYWTC